MPNRATQAFVFSLIGATYQIISPGIATLLDRNTATYLFIASFNNLFITGLIVFWSASHLLEDWKGRITWPSITLAAGIINLSNLVLAYFTPNVLVLLIPYGTLSSGALLALIPGPVIVIIGGFLGFSAVQRYAHEHGHAVLGHA